LAFAILVSLRRVSRTVALLRPLDRRLSAGAIVTDLAPAREVAVRKSRAFGLCPNSRENRDGGGPRPLLAAFLATAIGSHADARRLAA